MAGLASVTNGKLKAMTIGVSCIVSGRTKNGDRSKPIKVVSTRSSARHREKDDKMIMLNQFDDRN